MDEIMFTKSTNITHEWSKRKHNYSIPCESLGSKYTAVCAAISEGFGFELFTLYDEAVNHELFIDFIESWSRSIPVGAELNNGQLISSHKD